MSDSKAMGSVGDLLLNYVNTSIQHDTNFDIAQSLIKNYSQIKDKSCEELADMCYVSKASISRFCKFIGFQNYKEFQEACQFSFDIQSEYSKQFISLFSQDKQKALNLYSMDMIENIKTILTEEAMSNMEKVASTLYNSRNIVCFSHHFLWDIGKYFQSKMFSMGKYVTQYLNYQYQLECASSLSKDDVVIITSITGTYPVRYPEIWKKIADSDCKLIVITQNTSLSNWNKADFILSCGKTNKNDLGKYCALMVMDMIMIHYMEMRSSL